MRVCFQGRGGRSSTSIEPLQSIESSEESLTDKVISCSLFEDGI